MRYVSVLSMVCALAGLAAGDAKAQADEKCYELRIYTAPEGKLEALHRRFQKYSRRIFARYDMDRVGFWIPIENPENRFYYVLSYPDCQARDSSWARFFRDPEWAHVIDVTEADGSLTTNVEEIFMHAADFSPTIGPWMVSHPRVYELRMYTPHEGRFDALLARFRDHTVRIFQKHGMTNIAYWIDRDRERLIYLLAYPSAHFREESWMEFRLDREWQAVAEESQRDGPLVADIESILLNPTEYSPLR